MRSSNRLFARDTSNLGSLSEIREKSESNQGEIREGVGRGLCFAYVSLMLRYRYAIATGQNKSVIF